jgi:hypothetical protein
MRGKGWSEERWRQELSRSVERGYAASDAPEGSKLWSAWQDHCDRERQVDVVAHIGPKYARVRVDLCPAGRVLTRDGVRAVMQALEPFGRPKSDGWMRASVGGSDRGDGYVLHDRVPPEQAEALARRLAEIVREHSVPTRLLFPAKARGPAN